MSTLTIKDYALFYNGQPRSDDKIYEANAETLQTFVNQVNTGTLGGELGQPRMENLNQAGFMERIFQIVDPVVMYSNARMDGNILRADITFNNSELYDAFIRNDFAFCIRSVTLSSQSPLMILKLATFDLCDRTTSVMITEVKGRFQVNKEMFDEMEDPTKLLTTVRTLLAPVFALYPHGEMWYDRQFCVEWRNDLRSIYVLRDYDEIVGVALTKNTPHEQKLCSFYIDESLKPRLNKAELLLNHAMSDMDEYRDVYITVPDERNEVMRPLLIGSGFVHKQTLEGAYRDGVAEHYYTYSARVGDDEEIHQPVELFEE